MNISKLFRKLFAGRINRRNYLLGLASSIGLLFGFAIVFQSVENSFLGGSFGVTLLVLFVAIMVLNLSLHIRRLHDLGVSGWYFILIYILSIFGFLYLALAEGQKEQNRFGEVPSRDVIFPNQILGLENTARTNE